MSSRPRSTYSGPGHIPTSPLTQALVDPGGAAGNPPEHPDSLLFPY